MFVIQNQLIRTLLLQKFDLKWMSGEKRKLEDDHVQSFSRLKNCYQKLQKIVPLLLTQTQLFYNLVSPQSLLSGYAFLHLKNSVHKSNGLIGHKLSEVGNQFL